MNTYEGGFPLDLGALSMSVWVTGLMGTLVVRPFALLYPTECSSMHDKLCCCGQYCRETF